MGKEVISVAIDGPAGAGKSTIANNVASILKFDYIDTGAMYRALTLKVLNENKDPGNIDDVLKVLQNSKIDFNNNHILLDGKVVDEDIRKNIISKNVSYVSQFKEVRQEMVLMQQEMANTKSVIMDGRDITTVVLPNSKYKFFITASVEERARRRYIELLDKGQIDSTYRQILKDIKKRDEIDSNREVGPLSIADDAYVLDTTDKTIEESVDLIINIIRGGN